MKKRFSFGLNIFLTSTKFAGYMCIIYSMLMPLFKVIDVTAFLAAGVTLLVGKTAVDAGKEAFETKKKDGKPNSDSI